MGPIARVCFVIRRNSPLRRFVLPLLMLGLIAVSAFAGESQYKPPVSHYYCTANPAPNTRYYSGLFDLPASPDAEKQASTAFHQFLSKKYGVTAQANCQGNPDKNAAQAGMQQQVSQLKLSNWKIVQTGWTNMGGAQASASGVETSHPDCNSADAWKSVAEYKAACEDAAASAAAQGQMASAETASPSYQGSSAEMQSSNAAGNNAAANSVSAAGTILAVRMTEAVDSAKDGMGHQYHGIVTKPASAGGVPIPQGSMAIVTLSKNQSGWVAQLNSVLVRGQTMAVSSGPATLMNSTMGSAQNMAAGAMNTVSSALGGFGFGHKKPQTPSAAEAVASGQRILLPPGTQLQFVLTGASPASAAEMASGMPSAAGMPNMPQPGGGLHPNGPGANAMNSAGSSAAAASMPVGNLTAKVTETLLGPKNPAFVVSPDGGHYAVFSMHGSREVVVIDGVDGPEFDHAIAQNGGHSFDVLFTPDGKHSAYVAQRADDLIMVRDNKEAFVIVNVGPKSIKGLQPINQSGKHGWNIGGPNENVPSHACILSPSGAHTAVIVVDSSISPPSTYMLLDGVKSEAYATIDPNQVAFVGEKLVYAAQTRDQQWHMVVNDKPGPGYGSILRLTLTFDDMHYAFMAQNSGGHLVVLDGVPGPVRPHAGNGIQYLTLASNGRCAYIWDKPSGDPHGGGAQALVVDEKEVSESIAPFATEDKSLSGNSQLYVLFSPDGKKFAYARKIPGGVAAVIDGKVGRAYDGIGVISFSPDSAHSLFVGNRKLNFVVVDGQELEGFNQTRGFVWSKQGGRLGFIGYGQDGTHLVVDGKKTPKYYSVDNTLSFSPDSKHYVYSACTMYLKCVVVTDGNETPVPAVAQFSSRGQPHFEFPSIFWSEDSSRLAYAYSKSDGTSGTVFTVNGQEITHNIGTYEFPAFSPDSKHFATFYWTGHAYALFLDGKSSAPYEDLLEVNRNIARFESAHAYRFLGIKKGSVYRVTVDLASAN